MRRQESMGQDADLESHASSSRFRTGDMQQQFHSLSTSLRKGLLSLLSLSFPGNYLLSELPKAHSIVVTMMTEQKSS